MEHSLRKEFLNPKSRLKAQIIKSSCARSLHQNEYRNELKMHFSLDQQVKFCNGYF